MPTKQRLCKVSGCDKSRQGSPYCMAHAEESQDLPRCEYPGCGFVRLSNGLCQKHMAQLRRGSDLKPIVDWKLMPCRFQPCSNNAAGRGRYCTQHALQQRKTGRMVPILVGNPCLYPECEGVSGSNRGMCRSHQDRDWYLRTTYGITVLDWHAMYRAQGGQCAICGCTDQPLDVDHCHSSTVVRGLLCGPCNRGLGLFRDDPKALQNAIRYLAEGPCPENREG